jgi:hypothetical protein
LFLNTLSYARIVVNSCLIDTALFEINLSAILTAFNKIVLAPELVGATVIKSMGCRVVLPKLYTYNFACLPAEILHN